MVETSELLNSRQFTENLLKALNCAVLAIDESGRVLNLNNASKRLFGATAAGSGSAKDVGSVLNCLHAYEKQVGCGKDDSCKGCTIRNTALQSIAKNKPLESTTEIQIVCNGQVLDVLLSLSASPFNHQGKKICFLFVQNLKSDNYSHENTSLDGFHGIIGQNERMLDLFNTIKQIRSSSDPVLIQGESGTGKEMVALAIHRESKRAKNNFVPVNCGALPEGLLESEMFGHIKGAFTGATYEKKGRFKIADQGTIFLDEISELNTSMQVKFLRIIETGMYEPVGSDQTVSVNVRAISATNRMLEEELETGRFRRDLYYRLCVIPLTIPPLRDRRDDIFSLADSFLKKISYKQTYKTLSFSKDAISILENYDWPGNVRELQNIIKYAVLKCRSNVIIPKHFPQYLFQKNIHHVVRRNRKRKLNIADVADALRKANGNKRRTAKNLGVSRSTLYRFFDRHKIDSK